MILKIGAELAGAEMLVRIIMENGVGDLGKTASVYGEIGAATKGLGSGVQSVLSKIPKVGPALGTAGNLAVRAAPWAAGAYGASELEKAVGSPVRRLVRRKTDEHNYRQAQGRAHWNPQRGVMI